VNACESCSELRRLLRVALARVQGQAGINAAYRLGRHWIAAKALTAMERAGAGDEDWIAAKAEIVALLGEVTE